MTSLSPNPDHDQPLFEVPSGSQLTASLLGASLLSVLFVVAYGGADYVTGLRANHLRIDFAFEQNVPFLPEFSPLYSSLYLMFLAVPFVLHSEWQVWSYVRRMALITCVAGICFLLIPARLAFNLPADERQLPFSFQIADWLNLTYNLCPSLHVAYAAFHAELFRLLKTNGMWQFHSWALAIALAAWLTQQHHLIDLVLGYLLGVCAAARSRCVGVACDVTNEFDDTSMAATSTHQRLP